MGVLFTCSIDDGHPLDLKTAELLDKHGLSGTFYVPIKNREGPEVMNPQQIRELGRRFEIGSHTFDHCYLKHTNIWEAYDQIMDGKKMLEDVLNKPVAGFCYPGGKYQRRDVKLVEACGFDYARTTVNLRFDSGNARYEMPTTVQFFPHDRSVYLRNFAEAGQWMSRQEGLFLALQHEDWTERIFAMFDHARDTGGAFHLWWHSVEIEQVGAWQKLDGFLAYVAATISREDRITNRELAALQ
ncbi:Polysaccharide deacetylase [Noviherbaspirillum humi]|uniref:Polysaccharide deacetylase n=1 Tax=Noviherbaspirillum humi TaxID=1688639 RepID=A0A239D5E5_9BURK|nr:polysaccharide deacetylase family protein [Noviherbaspirillum humi]SNS27527.1 Polysaccharide deacetylase [Noviherbaspirillum humi]